MSKLGCLLLVWAVCEGVFSSEEEGFVHPLDFGAIFDAGDTGVTSLASNPLAAAVLKVDKSQNPQLFDTIVSSSFDSLTRILPSENAFAAENFGFNPIASQSFHLPVKSAKLVAQQNQLQPQSQITVPVGQQLGALRYDIRTVHDPNYKVYKSDEPEEGEEILAALKNNPTVAAYFQPAVTNVEIAHPLNYRKEELNEKPENEQIYKPNAYLTGPARIRRYTNGRQRENLRKNKEEQEEDPYSYKAEYISRPKAFDSDIYSSAYKQEKNPKKEYEYPYGYDSGYDHKEYERIKQLSEKQAAEIKQNPGNCQEVKKDGMSCSVCKDPKTGGNYESCSYVAEPKNNQYAYSKERKFDSNDEPDEVEVAQKPEQSQKAAKYVEGEKNDEPKYAKLIAAESAQPYSNYEQSAKDAKDAGDKYKAYYIHSSNPKHSEALRAAENEGSNEQTESVEKPYDYKKSLPGFYTETEPKKNVEHVLAEFKKKDRSSCNRVQKNGMTCFQCIDKAGLKNEECMFISESAPKRSHLAYQEVKEFTSKPATLDKENEEAQSEVVTTSAPVVQKSAAYVAENTNVKKTKRKKAPQTAAVAATVAAKTKRSVDSQAESKAHIMEQNNIAPPEEFAGVESKGAFWAETMPKYSASLGVTLPEYMLSRSNHEASFDEVIAGV